MKPGLEPGMTRMRRVEVDNERTIDFLSGAMRIYATPFMVQDIERTCRLFLDEFLDEGENSVGAHVAVDHLGPTLNGMWVDVTAKVASVEGRKVAFEVEVRDILDLVGRANHIRFVVDLEKQRQRLEAKAAKVKALKNA